MTLPTFDFNLSTDLLCGVAECREHKGHRYYLQGVHIEPAPDPANAGRGVRMVATDGNVLCVAYDADGYAARPMAITLDWSDKVLKTNTRDYGHRRITITGTMGRVAVAPAGAPDDGENAVGFAMVQPIDGEFPTYSRVLPRTDNAKERVFAQAFDPALIRRIETSAKRMGDVGGMHFLQSSDGDPALVRIAHQPDAFWVIMPYRFLGDTGLPGWMAHRPAQASLTVQEAAE
jgi:hypothetical protein